MTNKQNRQVYSLSNDFFAQLIRVVQQGMLTGTNIEDELKRIRVEPSSDDPNVLTLTQEYLDVYEKNLQDDAEYRVEKIKKEMKSNSTVVKG